MDTLPPCILDRLIIGPSDECWTCVRPPKKSPYPKLRVDGKIRQMHNVIYEIAIGPIPEGFCVHHRCFNKWCLNPNHLEAKSSKDHQHVHFMHKVCKTCGSDTWYIEPTKGRRICRVCRLRRQRNRMKNTEYREKIRVGQREYHKTRRSRT